MEIPLYQIDAFTGCVFGGNPAAVCPLEAWIDDRLMQKIALEAVKVGENGLLNRALGQAPLELYRKRDYRAIYRYQKVISPNNPGFAHSTLVPCWARHLNRDILRACQISRTRGLTCYLNNRQRDVNNSRAVPFLKKDDEYKSEAISLSSMYNL